jgi:hypothetical protein
MVVCIALSALNFCPSVHSCRFFSQYILLFIFPSFSFFHTLISFLVVYDFKKVPTYDLTEEDGGGLFLLSSWARRSFSNLSRNNIVSGLGIPALRRYG